MLNKEIKITNLQKANSAKNDFVDWTRRKIRQKLKLL